MNVKIDRSFEKDVQKIKNKALLKKIAVQIKLVQNANGSSQINGLKKIKGFGNYYRIRISDYRIGIIVNAANVEFIRFLHRKNIYKYFP